VFYKKKIREHLLHLRTKPRKQLGHSVVLPNTNMDVTAPRHAVRIIQEYQQVATVISQIPLLLINKQLQIQNICLAAWSLMALSTLFRLYCTFARQFIL